MMVYLVSVNRNLQDFTSYHINFLDFRFQKSIVISVISNKISGGAYEIWQQLVTPCLEGKDRLIYVI